MKNATPGWATAAVLACLAAAGCGTTYDGSNSFYDQHPEYRQQPSYMHPADSDDPAAKDARPW